MSVDGSFDLSKSFGSVAMRSRAVVGPDGWENGVRGKVPRRLLIH